MGNVAILSKVKDLKLNGVVTISYGAGKNMVM
jgi:hypothetical protein